jgi:hypothetical protein
LLRNPNFSPTIPQGFVRYGQTEGKFSAKIQKGDHVRPQGLENFAEEQAEFEKLNLDLKKGLEGTN